MTRSRFLVTSLALLGLATLPHAAHAQIASYTFPGTPGSLAPTTTAANAAAGSMNFTGSTASQFNFGGRLAFNVGVGATDAANAITNNSFVQFTVTPNAGFVLNLTSLDFIGARGFVPVEAGYVLRSSVDNFLSDAGGSLFTAQFPATASYSNDLSGAAFQNLTTSTTFRLYLYDTQVPNGNGIIDNLTLNGSVGAAVLPEPATLALLTLGIVGGAVALRRRR